MHPLSESTPLGPFPLAGPVEKPDPLRTPLRGDIAHVDLAGTYFVPHYVVPLQRMVGDTGANLRGEPSDASEILWDLSPGQRFDLMDSARGWAWGWLPGGPVGYVKLAELLDPFS
ncbi:MAG: hypothetical protein P0Y56_07105 [Candidatus Andeanibacterium colombiense]|uniref:Bacterial dipeptidyl-peptidase SH3 domain-containing protein n=1 Tax=Candidatus Andeanibacterium colombiense TaxID=3121345 RepID=A0AAJ6BQA8_9SPHN|nr:MAG: hypothetical protein P0Y56_07105 [Sphingomonadaceae bacterium]